MQTAARATVVKLVQLMDGGAIIFKVDPFLPDVWLDPFVMYQMEDKQGVKLNFSNPYQFAIKPRKMEPIHREHYLFMYEPAAPVTATYLQFLSDLEEKERLAESGLVAPTPEEQAKVLSLHKKGKREKVR